MVDLAKAVKASAGEASTSQAVLELAKGRHNDAEKKVHKVFAKFDLALPIPLSPIEHADSLLGMTRLKPIDFLTYMQQTGHLNKLLGGRSVASSGPMLAEFWANFKQSHPDFELFQYTDGNPLDDGSVTLEACVPVIAHIDGGRGYKRTEFLVFNWATVIGRGTGKLSRKDPSVRLKRNAKKMQVPLLGHSYLSHYLYAAMPASMHKGAGPAFQEMLQVFALDMRQCFDVGVPLAEGTRLRLVLLGLKGDLKLQAQAGRFNAWYSTARKRPLEKVKLLVSGRMCPWCPAGDVSAPFEELHTETPAWLKMQQDDPEPPWSEGEHGGMLGASLGYSAQPAKFYWPDLFHIYLLGIGQDFAASCLVYLLALVFKGPPGRNSVDAQLESLNKIFKQWRKMFKVSVHLTSFTRNSLSFPDYNSFPTGTWSKAGDTPKIINFISYIVSLWPDLCRQDVIVRNIGAACSAISACMRRLYASDLWIEPGLPKDYIRGMYQQPVLGRLTI